MRLWLTSALSRAAVRNLLTTGAIILVLLGCEDAGKNQPALATPVRKVAKERPAALLYRQKCADCHGDYGAGDGPAIRMLTVRPRDWTPASAFKDYNDETLKKWVVEGSDVPTGKQRPMPAFGDSLSDGEVMALISYVRAFAGKPIPERQR